MLLGYQVEGVHLLSEICTLLTVLAKHYIHVNKRLEQRPIKKGIIIYIKDVSKTEGNIYKNNGKILNYQKNGKVLIYGLHKTLICFDAQRLF